MSVSVQGVPLWKVVEKLEKTDASLRCTLPEPLRDRAVSGTFKGDGASQVLEAVLRKVNLAFTRSYGAGMDAYTICRQVYLHLKLALAADLAWGGPSASPGGGQTLAPDHRREHALRLRLRHSGPREAVCGDRRRMVPGRRVSGQLLAVACTVGGRLQPDDRLCRRLSRPEDGGTCSRTAPGVYRRVELAEEPRLLHHPDGGATGGRRGPGHTGGSRSPWPTRASRGGAWTAVWMPTSVGPRSSARRSAPKRRSPWIARRRCCGWVTARSGGLWRC